MSRNYHGEPQPFYHSQVKQQVYYPHEDYRCQFHQQQHQYQFHQEHPEQQQHQRQRQQNHKKPPRRRSSSSNAVASEYPPLEWTDEHGNRWFRCQVDQCASEPRDFARKCEHTAHTLMHRRPHKCEYPTCDFRGARQLKDLKKHLKTHYPASSIPCPLGCELAFTQLDNLKRHVCITKHSWSEGQWKEWKRTHSSTYR